MRVPGYDEHKLCPKCGTFTLQRIVRRGVRFCMNCNAEFELPKTIKKGRHCVMCGKPGGATFLSLLIRWGYYFSPERVNQFAHPECIAKEQEKRRKEKP